VVLQWMTVLHRLLRNTWQRKFEATLLPEPEVYKRHAFVIKGANDRLVLLSDLWFSNVEVTYKPTTVKSVKVRGGGTEWTSGRCRGRGLRCVPGCAVGRFDSLCVC
jgi:hypothetical protein